MDFTATVTVDPAKLELTHQHTYEDGTVACSYAGGNLEANTYETEGKVVFDCDINCPGSYFWINLVDEDAQYAIKDAGLATVQKAVSKVLSLSYENKAWKKLDL